MSITVKVKPELVETFVGFYGDIRRRPGDVFDLVDVVKEVDGKQVVIATAESFFSDKWMDRVEDSKPAKKIKPKATSENLTV